MGVPGRLREAAGCADQQPADITAQSPDIFRIVDFLFRFCPPNPSESFLFARFARLNIGPNQTFDLNKFPSDIQQAINDGIKDSDTDLAVVMKEVNNPQALPLVSFGSRDILKVDYLHRYAGAKLGLYGNTLEEAVYFGYFIDANYQPADASKQNYELRFDRGNSRPLGPSRPSPCTTPRPSIWWRIRSSAISSTRLRSRATCTAPTALSPSTSRTTTPALQSSLTGYPRPTAPSTLFSAFTFPAMPSSTAPGRDHRCNPNRVTE
jgi:hypothetical protein